MLCYIYHTYVNSPELSRSVPDTEQISRIIKPRERNVQQQKKKRKKRKETEEQAPMRDYRDALLADMQAIGKFCLCSVTLQVFKWCAYLCSKTKMYKNTSIPSRTFLHYFRFDGECNTN